MTDKMDLSEPALLEATRRSSAALDGIVIGSGDRGGETDTPTMEETRDETIARLSHYGRLDYEAARRTEARRLGFRVDVLDQAVERAKFERMHAEADAAQPHAEAMAAQQQIEVEAAMADTAAEIIQCDDVLDLFEVDWRRLVAGEVKNAKLLYLVATSRLLGRTMHAAIKGPSSAGKSEIRARVLEFFPPESMISFTSLSEKALLYLNDGFEHKILSMGEAAGAEEQSFQDYLLRELLSEGRLKYITVQKIGNFMETVIIEKEGPVAFMVTTTKSKLHPENETRMLSLEIDDSEAQTRRVLTKVAQVEGLGATAATVDFGPWLDFQRWLANGTTEVVVPYAVALAAEVPPRSVRLRRDLGQVLRAIMAHALLHRERRDLDDRGRIVANLDHDYAVVRDLMHGLLQETAEVKIKDTTLETIAAVNEVTIDMGADDGATCQAVARVLKLDRSAAHRRLRVAQDDGYVVNLETRKGRPGRYRATDQSVESETMLPTPEALANTLPAKPLKTAATVQPQPKDSDIPASYRLHDGLQPAPENPQPATAEQPGCNPDCNRQDVENTKESEGGCRVAAVSEGPGPWRERI